VEVEALWCEVWLNGRWFASARASPVTSAVVPTGQTARVDFSLPVAFRREGRRTETSFLTIAVRGTLEVSHGGQRERWPFTARERLEVDNAPVLSREREEFR
jgi:hypothetical protein